jgi:FkbM family methyltransferase
VEPQPYVANLLRKNLAQFKGRHQVFQLALSDADGEVNFLIDSRNRGKSRIVEEDTAETQRVETCSGDRFLSELNISKLDIVKIDVEGHEDAILTSCRMHFERLSPRIILFEGTRTKAAPSGPVGKLLNGIGYDVFGIEKKLSRLKLRHIANSVDRDFNDYVAISRKRQVPANAKTTYRL